MRKVAKYNSSFTKIGLVSTVMVLLLVVISINYFQKNKAQDIQKAKAAESNCVLSYTIPTPTPFVCTKSVDILAISIDRSSSMTQLELDGRIKLIWAKEASKETVTALITNNLVNFIKVGINSFGAQGNFSQIGGNGTLSSPAYDSLLHTPLTNNYTSVISAIDQVKYIKNGTCIMCGIRIANNQVVNSTNKKIVILLSDGMANRNWNGSQNNAKTNAINEANSGRNKGIKYHVVGYGVAGNIDETTLKAIAGTNGTYQYKPNTTDWASTFISIIQKECTTP